jgi:phosphoglycolate phosphatase
VIGDDVARNIIGLGLKAAQKLLFPEDKIRDAEFLTTFHAAYRKNYEAGEGEIPLYDGAYDLVRDLHGAGKIVAVATAKSRAGINRTLASTGLDAFVAHSRTPEECRPKPDPQMIRELMEATGIGPDEALMVGDTTHDLQMAVNAQVAAVGLTHGAHSQRELSSLKPLHVVDNLAELRGILF